MARIGRDRLAYTSFACTLAFTSPALAQEIGNYAGQTADGHSITFSVSTDPNDGKLELKSLTVGFSAACPESGTTINQSESFGLSDGPYDIASRKVSQLWTSNQLYMLNNITFASKTHTKGNTRTSLPQIVPGSIPPEEGRALRVTHAGLSRRHSKAQEFPTRSCPNSI